MNIGQELRKSRIEKGWHLRDIAVALGVTSATVSRIERGLQEPSPALLAGWQHLLAGKQWIPGENRGAQRRPRGVLSRLAKLFLADTITGLDESHAGWREPIEVGLPGMSIEALGSEVDFDRLGRIRIAPTSSLEPVRQAKRILEYRKAVEDDEQSLTPFVEKHLPILWQSLEKEETNGALLLAGLANMVRVTIPFVLDACRTVLGKDASCFLSNPAQPARVILESVSLIAPVSPSVVLRRAGLEELISACEERQEIQEAHELAHHLRLPALAHRLGKSGVTALGAAWAAISLLESARGALVTEVGSHHLAAAFWEGLREALQLSRTEVEDAWHRLNEIDEEKDGERVGALLWSWPEVF